MINSKKKGFTNVKGFTIVELVIVIAVVAILAAVLIPTFSNLIKKANLSADQQAVRQMNTSLAIYEAENGKPSNIKEVIEALEEIGYDAENGLTPITKGYDFRWDVTENVVVLIETSTWSVFYPEKYKSVSSVDVVSLRNGLTLSENQKVSQLIDKIQKNETITLGTNNYTLEDIIETSVLTGETFAGATIVVSENITISSLTNQINVFKGTLRAEDNVTITVNPNAIVPVHQGFNNNGYVFHDAYSTDRNWQKTKTGYGVINCLGEGGLIENITVKYNDTTFPADPGNKYTYFGGIVGVLDGGTIKDCNVSGTIKQYGRVGGVVGMALSGTIENCTVSGTIECKCSSEDTSGVYSYAGGVVAYAGEGEINKAKILNLKKCDVSNLTVGSDDCFAAAGLLAWKADVLLSVNMENCTVSNLTVTATNEVLFHGIAIGAVREGSLSYSVTITGTNGFSGTNSTKTIKTIGDIASEAQVTEK